MKILKRLFLISGAIVRSIVGISGAILVILALIKKIEKMRLK
jgi:hypothetical protein